MKSSFVLDLGKEKRVLRGDVRFPKGKTKAPFLLLCHGFKAFKDWGFFPYLANRLQQAGFAVITFHFSMNGIGKEPDGYTELDKFARLTYSREQEDLAFLFQAIQKKEIPFAEQFLLSYIGLFGHSRGGGNCLLFANEHPEVKSVVVWNSIPKVDFFEPEILKDIQEKGIGYSEHAWTGEKMPILREVLEDIEQNRQRFDIMEAVKRLSCPLCIVEGSEDYPTFFEGALKMARLAQKAELHIIEGANHAMTIGKVQPFPGTTPPLEKAISKTITFFQKMLMV